MGGLLANARVAGRRRRDCRCALSAAGRRNGILGAMMVLCFPCDHQTRTDLQVGSITCRCWASSEIGVAVHPAFFHSSHTRTPKWQRGEGKGIWVPEVGGPRGLPRRVGARLPAAALLGTRPILDDTCPPGRELHPVNLSIFHVSPPDQAVRAPSTKGGENRATDNALIRFPLLYSTLAFACFCILLPSQPAVSPSSPVHLPPPILKPQWYVPAR